MSIDKENYDATYKSSKFFRLPNDSGIVPVKLLADRRLPRKKPSRNSKY